MVQTARPKSKADLRKSRILERLLDGSTVQISELARDVGVSLMTIHRDLSDLEAAGVVDRVRGAVSAEKSALFESSYLFRSQKCVEQKQRLARAAVRHIKPGDAVIWDDSTTTFQMCDFIADVAPITVITNGLPVLERLSMEPKVDLIALGGKYNRGYNGYFGLACEQSISGYRVDVALMSATAVQDMAIFTQDEQVVRVKQAMMRIARRKLLLIDCSKFDYLALNYVADLNDFDLVIVPANLDPARIDVLREAGIPLELA